MMVPASGLLLRALGLPHARGRARLEHALRTSPRHSRVVLRRPAIPFRRSGVRPRGRGGRRARRSGGSRGGRTGPPRGTTGPAPSAFAPRTSRPSSARTRTASSRYACATRTGDARTPARLSTGCHSTSSALPGLSVPGTSFCLVGLELEQVAPQRPFETGQSRLGALRGSGQRRFTAAGRRRRGLSSRPALQQPAKSQRRDLARAELRDEPLRGRSFARVVDKKSGQLRAVSSRPDASRRIWQVQPARSGRRSRAPRQREAQCSYLHYDRKNHGPPPRSVVHELGEPVVEVLL